MTANRLPELESSLLDILHAIDGTDIRIIVGGGFGIYLKRRHCRETGVRTLLTRWPEARSTNDLDLYLRPELLIEPERLKPLARAIDRLGYRVIPSAAKYQFVKPGPDGSEAGSVKIDILTGPRSRFSGTSVKADGRRARPKPSVGLHAHTVDEALTLEDGLFPVAINGHLTSGGPHLADVFLPHPFTYTVMKLFAFGDRIEDSNKDYGRYHALDIYTILATTTEKEWEHALHLRDLHKDAEAMVHARGLVRDYFTRPADLGVLRMKESPYFTGELEIDAFIPAIRELFPPPG